MRIITSLLFLFISSLSLAQSPYIDGGPWQTNMICDSGYVYSTGRGNYGMLGNGTTTTSYTWVQSTVDSIVEISTGREHTLALDENGRVWTWGHNDQGQLGIGNNLDQSTPQVIPTLDSVWHVCAGQAQYHSFALRLDSTVWGWGNNQAGQLGYNGADSNVPVQIPNLTGVVYIGSGDHWGLAVKADGTVWAWGDGTGGQLGNGSSTSSPTPVQVIIDSVIGVKAMHRSGIAWKSNGKVEIWGTNSSYGLGDGVTTSTNTPISLPIDSVIDIAVGYYHCMMLKQNGTLWGFGKGTLGEMGNGLSQNSPTIIQVPGLTNIIDVESGWYRPYAVTDTGSILVWGRNHYGQYGNGNTTASASPVLMTLPCNLSEGCAVKPDFSLSAQAVCVGDSVSVTNNSSGASTFSWQKNGQFYSNAVAPTFGMDSVGTTTITLIAEDSSCTKQTSMTVTVNALPVANVGADTSICLGDTISLSVSPAASSYNWSNGDTSQSTFVSVAGTYWCQITDANGCIDSDSMTLGTAQMPQATFMTASNQLSVTFTGLGPGPTFAWDFGDGNTGTGPSFTYTYQSSGTYYVCCTETNSIGCTTTSCDSVTVLITSIANQQLEDFKLYPNPTNGHVKLELKSQIQPSHLTFQDMRGRQLRVVADFQLRGGVFEAELNLGSFADGVYFYSMLVGEEIVSGKITVRK